MSRFRILSIDGGGIKGVFPAAVLAEVEKHVDQPIHRYFDLIAGTSTGGIIAIGLGLGLPASAILELYTQRGPDIFPAKRRTRRARVHSFFFGSRYSPDVLRSELMKAFGDSTLGDSRVPLLIPTLSATLGKIHVYKTPHHPRLKTDWRSRMVDVALATSAAPTYLPAHISPQGVPFLDGGLWTNNPTGMAVVEGITMMGAERSNVEVLSLGCTEEPRDFTVQGNAQIDWARAVLDAAMSGQTFASMGTAALLVGHDHITRINPTVAPGRFSLDDTKGIQHLCAFGYEEARIAVPRICACFLSEVASIYTPLYQQKTAPTV